MDHISTITPAIAGIIVARSLQQHTGADEFCPWCDRYLKGNTYSCPHCNLII